MANVFQTHLNVERGREGKREKEREREMKKKRKDCFGINNHSPNSTLSMTADNFAGYIKMYKYFIHYLTILVFYFMII